MTVSYRIKTLVTRLKSKVSRFPTTLIKTFYSFYNFKRKSFEKSLSRLAYCGPESTLITERKAFRFVFAG